MENEMDYLIPEFLYLLAFQECPVVIRPFTYTSKLQKMIKILDIIFDIAYFDASAFGNVENYDLFLSAAQERNEEGKKKLVFISNLSEDLVKILPNYKIVFLAIEKMENLDYVPFDRITIYDKKKGEFILYYPDDVLTMTTSLKWCQNQFKSIQTLGLDKMMGYVKDIYQNTRNLMDVLTDYSKSKYYENFRHFTTEERAVMRGLCSSQFEVMADSILPANDEAFFKDFSTLSDETNAEEHEKQRLLKELGQIELDHKFYFSAFSDALMRIPIAEPTITPIEKFIYLKRQIWQKFVPTRFIDLMLIAIAREELKNKPTSSAGLDDILKSEHKMLIRIFGEIGFESKHFSKVDVQMISQDSFIQKVIEGYQQRQLPENNPSPSALTTHSSPNTIDDTQFQHTVEDFRKKYPNNPLGVRNLNAFFEQKIRGQF